MQIHTKVTMEVNLNRKGVYSTIGKTISETMTDSLNFANQLIKEATMQSAQIEMQFPAPNWHSPLSPWNNANILFLLQQCINLSPHLLDFCFKGFKNISRALVQCLLWLVTVQYCCDIIRIVVAGNKSSRNKPDIPELELSFTSPNR